MLDGRHEGLPPPSVLRALGWQSLHMQAGPTQCARVIGYDKQTAAVLNYRGVCCAAACLHEKCVQKTNESLWWSTATGLPGAATCNAAISVMTQKTSAEANNLRGHLDIVRELYHPQHSNSLEDHWEIWDC